jgi:pilus assembly protein FimV
MPQQKQGPVAALLNNPVVLAAAGGGLLVLLLLIALIMKRRKSGDGDEELPVASNLDNIVVHGEDSDVISEVEDEQLEQKLAEVEAGAESVAAGLDADTVAIQTSTEETVAASAEAEAEAPGAAEDEPRDEVIAEADVYLAYGIYQQAEELLQNAIKDNPDKDSYRVKLAETYLAGKNSDGFIELATEMNQRRGNEDTPAWQRIVAIGQELVPGHALISGASAGGLSMGDEPASESPEPLDIEPGSEEGQQAAVPELDLAFDESEAGIVEPPEEALASAESVEFDLSETGAEAATETGESEETIEFGLGETQAFEVDQTTQEFALDIEASELGIEDDEAGETDAGEFNLDLSAETEEALAADDEAEDKGFSLDDVNEASLDFDTSDSEAVELDIGESQDETTAALDMSETSMEEAVVEMVTEPETEEPESKPESVADSMDLGLSDLDDIDEVSTKLDLAKAYLDMGDADGTRSILDEVMTEGNDDQKKEADDLLRQLG